MQEYSLHIARWILSTFEEHFLEKKHVCILTSLRLVGKYANDLKKVYEVVKKFEIY